MGREEGNQLGWSIFSLELKLIIPIIHPSAPAKHSTAVQPHKESATWSPAAAFIEPGRCLLTPWVPLGPFAWKIRAKLLINFSCSSAVSISSNRCNPHPNPNVFLQTLTRNVNRRSLLAQTTALH
ncbi:hypothetical protein ACLOJK_022103 [Asimina triloba]